MSAKPDYLRPARAAVFQDAGVIEAYPQRPPYPAEIFAILRELMGNASGTKHAILDVGCGTGDLARNLVSDTVRVDALDWSRGMLAKGQTLPGGAHPNLRWIHGRAEEATWYPLYDLVTAGETLHWMDWEVVLPRFRAALKPHGFLAVVWRKTPPTIWHDALQKLIVRFSTNPDYKPVDLFAELRQRGLFEQLGERHTAPVPFTQSIGDYIESFHSMSSFSRQRMGQANAAAFDSELKALVSGVCTDGQVVLPIEGGVVWGIPKAVNGEQ